MNKKFNDKESLKYQLLNAKIIRTKNAQYNLSYNDTLITINPSTNYIGFLFLYVLEMLKKEIKNVDDNNIKDDVVIELNNLSIDSQKVNEKVNDNNNNNNKKKIPLNPFKLYEITKK